jgi:hypothetical protein
MEHGLSAVLAGGYLPSYTSMIVKLGVVPPIVQTTRQVRAANASGRSSR